MAGQSALWLRPTTRKFCLPTSISPAPVAHQSGTTLTICIATDATISTIRCSDIRNILLYRANQRANHGNSICQDITSAFPRGYHGSDTWVYKHIAGALGC